MAEIQTRLISNAEREVIALPDSWKSISDLGEVTLYQEKISPPCCKLRMIFKWYKIPFKTITGKKPDSDYQKIPVVVVNGIQINDSYVVVRSLAPILDSSALTPELIEVEEMTTFGLMIALELDVASSCIELQRCSSLLDGVLSVVLWSLACCLCCFAGSAIKSKNPGLLRFVTVFFFNSFTFILFLSFWEASTTTA